VDIKAFFANPNPSGIGIALLFGLLWLAPMAPPLRQWKRLLIMLVGGALLFAPSIAWVQVPLQKQVGNLLTTFFAPSLIQGYLPIFAIPQGLLSGLVQEGAKLAPVIIYLRLYPHRTRAKTALIMGATAGMAYGTVEAQWVLNQVFALGWSWQTVQLGWEALLPFWERLFTVAFHIATAAIAAWGLAKGRGWRFYLLVSLAHFAANYPIVFLQAGYVSIQQVEAYIALLGSGTMGVALWLRWRRELLPHQRIGPGSLHHG